MESVHTQKITRTLKNGTVKEYVYKRKFIVANPTLHKQKLYDAIRDCDDKEKIDAIAKSIDEILNNQVKQDNAENNN